MFKILEKNGEEYAYVDPKYKKKMVEKKYEYLLNLSGIPRFYWDIEFSDYKGKNSLKEVEKLIYYAKNFNDKKFKYVHLYLWGINNSQKTALACNVGKEILKQGYDVKFTLAGVLIDKLMKLQGYGYQEELENEIKKLKQAKVLIIDDIFDSAKSILWSKSDSADLIITAWDSFLRGIISSNTKLILTSNEPVNVLQTKFKKSIYHLIDRNFISIALQDDVKVFRKKSFENLFPEGEKKS